VMAASFHPELTNDDRVHRMFLDLVDAARRN
jgi:glutamine amidotransferase PdxT